MSNEWLPLTSTYTPASGDTAIAIGHGAAATGVSDIAIGTTIGTLDPYGHGRARNPTPPPSVDPFPEHLQVIIHPFDYDKAGLVNPCRLRGDPHQPVSDNRWVTLPGDILRNILWRHLDVFDRVISCWGVCRRWNWELNQKLECSDPYTFATQRTIDANTLRRYNDEAWIYKYGPLWKSALDGIITATYTRKPPNNKLTHHIARVYAFHYRSSYMQQVRRGADVEIAAANHRANIALQKLSVAELKIGSLEQYSALLRATAEKKTTEDTERDILRASLYWRK